MNDPLIGQQLANFRVERLIGRGGMAQVYYGQDVKLHRAVAIKVIDARFRDNPAYAHRFVNEACMMAQWRHENIVQIYYADDHSDLYYYVMEYIDGHDLDTVMSFYSDDRELMPIADILRIGRAVASALDYAHHEGIVHRDVKPANVMIARDGRVMLGDFGMALDIQGGSIGEAFGTPHYISPEQARRSADAIPQSDLYSFGVILYEILTGIVPFNDPSPASVALQHITQQPPPPRTINPELSMEVEAVLLKALEKDPRDRYQTGAQLMDALEQALSTKVDAKIPMPPIPIGVPTVRRSDVSLNSMTKRIGARRTSLKTQMAQPRTVLSKLPVEYIPEQQSADSAKSVKKSKSYFFIGLILIAALSAFFIWFRPNLLQAAPATEYPLVINTKMAETPKPSATFTISPSMTFTSAIPATELVIVHPSFTETLTPALTATSSATSEPTATEPAAATSTPVPSSPTAPPATVKFPDGNHFTLFYNESSLHLLNRSRAIRSVNGFDFERINLQGQTEEKFDGYLWEKNNATILPKYCTAIKVYDSVIPYIDPPDCQGGYVSIVQPKQDEDRTMLFWTPKENSAQFRVLWNKEEVARCEISAGICEFYVP